MLDDKKLKQEIIDEISDDKIPNLSRSIVQKYLDQKSEVKIPWYKRFFKPIAIATPIIAVASILAIVIPISLNSNNTTSGGVGPLHPVIIQGKENEIAFGVLSANNMIDAMQISSTGLKKHISQDAFKKEIDYFNPYMITCETMFNNEFDVKPNVEMIDGGEYLYRMTIDSEEGEILFYYNEIIDNENRDDDEQEYHIVGVFEKDGYEYQVKGDKELETDEYELELTVYLNESAKDYIKIEQEIENDDDEQEQTYLYSLFYDNDNVFMASVNFEVEDDRTPAAKTVIEVDEKRSTYYILKSRDDYYKCQYVMDDEKGAMDISVIEENGKTYYLYEEKNLGYSYKKLRN